MNGPPDKGEPRAAQLSRRQAVKKGVMGACGLALGAKATYDYLAGSGPGESLRVGFRNSAPAELPSSAKEAAWFEASGPLVRCLLCPHRCVLRENDRGFCRARVARNGRLYSLAYGNPCALHLDPMEKKPLYHFLPGSPILSLATGGCNLRCPNCQNWSISQSNPEELETMELSPAQLVRRVSEQKIPALAYTYSEPIIFYEYVRDTAVLARERGIRNVLVTAGYISEEPLRELCGVVDAANVDLKGFSDHFYKRLTGSKLEPVLRCLEVMREEGVWVEVTRLVVPGYSDDMDDMEKMCRWLVRALGPDTPLHFSRFHPAYKLQGLPPTPPAVLDRAHEIARASGLRHVFVGNIPGHEAQNTLCPGCGRPVIERSGYRILANRLEDSRCPCGQTIAGIWL